jgi:hypothetical protein
MEVKEEELLDHRQTDIDREVEEIKCTLFWRINSASMTPIWNELKAPAKVTTTLPPFLMCSLSQSAAAYVAPPFVC